MASMKCAGTLCLLVAFATTWTLGQESSATRAADAARNGWQAIREGHNQHAATAFGTALESERRDPSIYLGAGLAAYLLGQPTRARAFLDQAIQLAPAYTAASLLLGNILYRGSDLDGAMRVYEAALVHAPDNAVLTRRLEEWRREAWLHSRFFQSQGAHFTVLFEGPADEQLARRALESLEAAYWRVGTVLYTFPEQIITVVLYTQEQFRDITRSPAWAAAVYDGQIRVPVGGALERADELDRVLAHEFTHALVRSIAPRGVPSWLNEGLAVVFEPNGRDWATEQLTKMSVRVPPSRLSAGFDGFNSSEAQAAYAQSAAAVDRLIELAGTAAVVGLLQDIAQGSEFAAAFAQRVLMSYESFVSSLP
jgi:tetratricopeptide (TPR) repeat protein